MKALSNIVVVSGMIIAVFAGHSDKGDQEHFTRELSVSPVMINDTIKNGSLNPQAGRLCNQDIINRFFEKNRELFSSKWNNRDKVEQMISAICNSSSDGLNPDDYHIKEIGDLMQKIISSEMPDVEDANRLDYLLTDSFLLLSSHLSSGKTDPETIDPLWKVTKRVVNPDLEKIIDSTLERGNISEILQHLIPVHPDYFYLRNALSKYRQLQADGGWKTFSTKLPKLEFGMIHPDVDSLRKRLAVTQGYVKPDSVDGNFFDKSLLDQVIIFQQRNGLEADGVAGKGTISELNIPIEERIETIEANLERWRWISDDLGELYIRVDIANFNLQVMEKDKPVFESPVIVGRQYRQTPVFGAVMKYLILNPDWTVPPTILTEDILPVLIKDRSYLAKNDMKIINSDGTEIDPSSIDWGNVTVKNFPYMIRQEPGEKCPLGKVKFIFPNEYDVYIHDTPSRSLFSQSIRTFSSGCIRIGRAFDLAAYILKDDPKWDHTNLQKTIDDGQKTTVILKNPIPVYILYLTAWADENGIVYFGKDVYDRDRKLISALKQINPRGMSKNSVTGEIPVKNSTNR
jgi:murein L,D-transpeptidase YcbB/YkuD